MEAAKTFKERNKNKPQKLNHKKVKQWYKVRLLKYKIKNNKNKVIIWHRNINKMIKISQKIV